MPHPESFLPLPPAGALMYGLRPFDVMVFYPEIRYRGVRVLPYSWHPTETEPVLLVDVYPYDRDLYARYFLKPPKDHDEMLRALKLDGWDVYDGREGAWKYVHVDELEKIEGPPPEGAF